MAVTRFDESAVAVGKEVFATAVDYTVSNDNLMGVTGKSYQAVKVTATGKTITLPPANDGIRGQLLCVYAAMAAGSTSVTVAAGFAGLGAGGDTVTINAKSGGLFYCDGDYWYNITPTAAA